MFDPDCVHDDDCRGTIGRPSWSVGNGADGRPVGAATIDNRHHQRPDDHTAHDDNHDDNPGDHHNHHHDHA